MVRPSPCSAVQRENDNRLQWNVAVNVVNISTLPLENPELNFCSASWLSSVRFFVFASISPGTVLPTALWLIPSTIFSVHCSSAGLTLELYNVRYCEFPLMYHK